MGLSVGLTFLGSANCIAFEFITNSLVCFKTLHSYISHVIFSSLQVLSEEQPKPTSRWLGKTNFVETRSFWQIFRSFDRMWSFFVLSLQVLLLLFHHSNYIPSRFANDEFPISLSGIDNYGLS